MNAAAAVELEQILSVRERITQIEANRIPETLEGLIRKLRPILGVMGMENYGDAFEFAQEEQPELTAYDYWKDIYLMNNENPSISEIIQTKYESILAMIKINKIESLKKELKSLLSRKQFQVLMWDLEQESWQSCPKTRHVW
jgi:5-methylcytosine-specific restriction endonuclease McrBC GTP-binding regulatory subunit McrB